MPGCGENINNACFFYPIKTTEIYHGYFCQKNDKICITGKILFFSAQIHMPALVVARSIVFPRVTGVNSGLVSVLLRKKIHGYSS